jgi:hypothetical protein
MNCIRLKILTLNSLVRYCAAEGSKPSATKNLETSEEVRKRRLGVQNIQRRKLAKLVSTGQALNPS